MHVKPFEYEWCDDWPWLTFIHQEKNSPTLGELDKKKIKPHHVGINYTYVHTYMYMYS